MNPQIRKIAEEAEYNYLLYAMCSEGLEKFARLIIDRCVQQCWTISDHEFNGRVVMSCEANIRSYFDLDELEGD